MRVLHVIPSIAKRSGGPATAIVSMCGALREQGVEVLLVSTEGEPQINTDFTDVPVMIFPAQFGASFKYSRPLRAWLKDNVAGFDVVHIHAIFNHASVAAARACRDANVPYIVRPLGTLDPWSMKQKALRKRAFWLLAGKRMLEGSAAVHYTAQAEKDATEKHLGMNHGRVIGLGVDANASSPTNSLAQHFPELAKQPYVLVLSRLHPKKGLDILIDAFKSVSQDPRFASWRLVIAGDGPLDCVVLLRAKADNSDKIIFTGWVEGERREALLAGASLSALPSRQENFGFCVLESLAHGVPVLLSPHVNVSHEIAEGGAGWIADVEKNALAATLAEALADDEERARRGRAGQLLSERYSWTQTARELVELYRQVTR